MCYIIFIKSYIILITDKKFPNAKKITALCISQTLASASFVFTADQWVSNTLAAES